jgi:hypothetical protein
MTPAELAASVRFDLLFQHANCEQSMRQFRCYASTLDEPQFSIEASDANSISGKFVAQVQLEDGPHGTFQMAVPQGWQSADVHSMLENADLRVNIESAPQ